MDSLESKLLDYLEDITGDRPELKPLPDQQTARLPMFLRERYSIRSTRLFDNDCLLALESPEWDAGSTMEYARHVETLRAALGAEVGIVLRTVASWSRNRLVRAGVPFIVPGSQLFLPFGRIDLRERFAVLKNPSEKPLTPAAQAVFLYHLLKQPLDDLPLREIAPLVGYTPMMITKVKDELEGAMLCDAVREGRSMVLKFSPDKRALWEKAESKLSPPMKKIHGVKWENPSYPALAAGMTALSNLTMIEDDPLPTYALWDTTFRANLERGIFVGCPYFEGATVLLQAWTYNPLLLGDGRNVDPLSLYLSLRHHADERVQQQLKQLIEQMPW